MLFLMLLAWYISDSKDIYHEIYGIHTVYLGALFITLIVLHITSNISPMYFIPISSPKKSEYIFIRGQLIGSYIGIENV